MIRVVLSGQLKDWTKGTSELKLERGGDVSSVVQELDSAFPGIGQRIMDDQDKVRVHVNVFVNSENVRDLAKERTKVTDGDVIHILPSVSGG